MTSPSKDPRGFSDEYLARLREEFHEDGTAKGTKGPMRWRPTFDIPPEAFEADHDRDR